MTSLLALDLSAIESAFWHGAFELLVLGIVAVAGNIVYQRYRELAVARQALVDGIDEFTVRLYKPRKMYQTTIDRSHDLFANIDDATQRETHRAETVARALEEVIDAVGRFRALQVKLVPLFGFHVELFAFYLAIWRYLKEVRYRMERGESLYFHHEEAESVDAFYRLIDTFRYRLRVTRIAHHPPALTRPPYELLNEMRQRGDALYEEYFAGPPREAGSSTLAEPQQVLLPVQAWSN